jgi:hypothetical protein
MDFARDADRIAADHSRPLLARRRAFSPGNAFPGTISFAGLPDPHLKAAFKTAADFQHRSLPACTAWSCADKSAGRFAAWLPECWVSPAHGSVRPGSPLAAFCPEPVARNGFSLSCNGCRLSATSIPGSKFPACHFASLPDGFRARSALRLHRRQTGFRRLRPLHCLGPVALPLPGMACRSRCLHSPPGLLHPSGSKRSAAFAASQST